MQAPRETKKPKSKLAVFMETNDNTHNRYTSVTAIAAIQILSRHHKPRPDAHAKIISEMIIHGVLTKNSKEVMEFKCLLDDVASRNQDQWDFVPCYTVSVSFFGFLEAQKK